MARHIGALTFDITPEAWDGAVQSASGSCLVKAAIAERYPFLDDIKVNTAQIRATDKRHGERILWMAPHSVGMVLLHFDQGWAQPETRRIQTSRPVQVIPVTNSAPREAKRAERRAELEAKDPAELTRPEKAALTTLRRHPARPNKRGPAQVRSRTARGEVTIGGGAPRPTGHRNPNLLGGSDRHFGQRIAHPGEVFDNAVDTEIARRRAAGEL